MKSQSINRFRIIGIEGPIIQGTLHQFHNYVLRIEIDPGVPYPTEQIKVAISLSENSSALLAGGDSRDLSDQQRVQNRISYYVIDKLTASLPIRDKNIELVYRPTKNEIAKLSKIDPARVNWQDWITIEKTSNGMDQLKDSPVIKILFLAADPTNETRLRLGEELREIQEKLRLANLRDRFDLKQRLSVRPEDISQGLLDEKPHIVHFSGHGAVNGELCFENRAGESHPIKPEALAALFKQFAGHVKCVVLNACYSDKQANSIAEHIEYVVGMNQRIGDRAAIAFSIGFYQALGAGRPIDEAFELGRVQIGLQGIPEHLTPVLIKKNDS